jgi:hypothetical protein
VKLMEKRKSRLGEKRLSEWKAESEILQ